MRKNLPGEQWKPVVGYEDLYEVSDLGRVWSHYRGGRFIKAAPNTSGYFHINARNKTRLVHSLVMEAFVGPRPRGLDIRHLDGESQNNALSNLEYATRSRNCQDKKWHKGTTLYVLRPSDVLDIKRRLGARGTGRLLAREYGVSDSIISDIKKGKIHKDVNL